MILKSESVLRSTFIGEYRVSTKMIRCVLIFFLLIISVLSSIVYIEQGGLRGTISKSRGGVEFYSFYGIPYALPPVDDLRFQPPRGPPPKWEGLKNATNKPPECVQLKVEFSSPRPINPEVTGSEDCLYLNIFTPKLGNSTSKQKLLPVLVFIHGGGFASESGNRAVPDFFLDKSIVLVGINYRLGVFGFFSTGEVTASGNYGLKDQTEALKWINKNIKAFGGDENSVTIMGQSAGGASVHFHTFSPLSKGLFHKIIVQSGVATHGWSLSSKQDTRRKSEQFLQAAKCTEGTIDQKLSCLRKIPAAQLINLEAFSSVKNQPAYFSFRPTIEDGRANDTFITKNPKDFLYEQVPEVPSIWGYTANESASLARRFISEHPVITEDQFNTELPSFLHYNIHPQTVVTNITMQIKKIYFKDSLTNVNNSTMNQLMSDFFKFPIVSTIISYPGKKFWYEYAYQNEDGQPGFGAQHSEDLRSFFPNDNFHPITSEEDVKVSKSLIIYWTNFITSGDPNLPDTTKPTDWTQVSNSTLYYLHIYKNGFTMKKYYDPEKNALWKYIKNL